MKILSCLSGFALLALSSGPALALDPAAEQAVMQKAVDLYIQPAYQRFHADATELTRETAKLCSTPSSPQLAIVHDRFGKLAESWARIEIVRVGPVLEENRFERILFYPDRKSIGMKQVQAILAKKDETATDPKVLATKSVAIQGLGAFEFLFFGFYPEGLISTKNSFHCRYGLAIAENVEAMAETLDRDWHDPQGVSKSWKEPSRDNPVYRDGAEAVAALIGIHVHGIEAVRDQRFKPFYKDRKSKLAPKAALFWRSGNTMRMIRGNVEGLAELWQVSAMRALLPEDSGSLADSVEFDYKSAASAIAKLEPPTGDNLADPKYLSKLDFVEFTLKDAIARINTDVAAAIGLGAGFSFADGD